MTVDFTQPIHTSRGVLGVTRLPGVISVVVGVKSSDCGSYFPLYDPQTTFRFLNIAPSVPRYFSSRQSPINRDCPILITITPVGLVGLAGFFICRPCNVQASLYNQAMNKKLKELLDTYYTIYQAAKILGKHPSQVWRYTQKEKNQPGYLPSETIGMQRFILRSEVKRFIPPPVGNPNFQENSEIV